MIVISILTALLTYSSIYTNECESYIYVENENWNILSKASESTFINDCEFTVKESEMKKFRDSLKINSQDSLGDSLVMVVLIVNGKNLEIDGMQLMSKTLKQRELCKIAISIHSSYHIIKDHYDLYRDCNQGHFQFAFPLWLN